MLYATFYTQDTKLTAMLVNAILCYLVLEKVFCDFCLSGFVMGSYKAIILTFSL